MKYVTFLFTKTERSSLKVRLNFLKARKKNYQISKSIKSSENIRLTLQTKSAIFLEICQSFKNKFFNVIVECFGWIII